MENGARKEALAENRLKIIHSLRCALGAMPGKTPEELNLLDLLEEVEKEYARDRSDAAAAWNLLFQFIENNLRSMTEVGREH